LGQSHELGTIAEGQLADIMLLSLEENSFLPLHDPYLHLIYCEHGNAVDTVIVNGEVVVEHGKIITVDEQSLHQEIREHVEFAAHQRAQRLTMTASTTEMLDKLTQLRHLVLKDENH
jgi:cytosine/adenosine deaminase-related metal-dependent hydrolase